MGGAHADRWLTISCDDVSRCRVERYRSQRKEEGRFGRVDECTERHDVVEDNRATTLMYGWPKKFTYIVWSVSCMRRDTPTSIELHKAACIYIYGRVV